MRLETDRLILREWVEAYLARAALSFATLGMGRFAVERRSDGACLNNRIYTMHPDPGRR
jgi:hypothetical protein